MVGFCMVKNYVFQIGWIAKRFELLKVAKQVEREAIPENQQVLHFKLTSSYTRCLQIRIAA